MPIDATKIRQDDGKFPAYAWPGGYAVAYICQDGEYLCADCVNDPANPVYFDGSANDPQWHVIGYDTADWHDLGESDWICEHCGKMIDAAPVETPGADGF